MACILSCEWYSTTPLIQPVFLKSTFHFFILSLVNLLCMFQQNWTYKLNFVPFSSPLLKKIPLVFTWYFRQTSPSQLHGRGMTPEEMGIMGPESLMSYTLHLSPEEIKFIEEIQFLQERFNTTTTTEENAVEMLY